jgi:ferredoxin
MSRPQALPQIDPDRCTGCGRCVAACEPKVLWLETEAPNGWGRKQAVLHDPSGCTVCVRCVQVCPFDAVRMVKASGLVPLQVGGLGHDADPSALS